jgi:hypothetical protein
MLILIFIYIEVCLTLYFIAGLHNFVNPKVGILFRLESPWIGAHYSNFNKRWCINLIPFLTIYIGNPPIHN